MHVYIFILYETTMPVFAHAGLFFIINNSAELTNMGIHICRYIRQQFKDVAMAGAGSTSTSYKEDVSVDAPCMSYICMHMYIYIYIYIYSIRSILH